MRNGNAIAPLLFKIAMENAVRSSKVETWGTIFDKESQIMAYAGDVIIMGRKLQDIEEVFLSLV